MAGADDTTLDWNLVVDKVKSFCKPPGSDVMTQTAIGKLAKDCLEKDYKKYDIKNMCDASVFPKCTDEKKKTMTVNVKSVKLFVKRTAWEIAKKQGDSKTPMDSPAVEKLIEPIALCIQKNGPVVKSTKISKTGNVDGMTDTSKYTGSHGERFDKSGKGKGIEGREDRSENSGYTGQYKGKDTYDKK